MRFDGNGVWTDTGAAPAATHNCPPGMTWNAANNDCEAPASQNLNYCQTNTPGWSVQNGLCLPDPTPTAPTPTTQKMVQAAGMSDGLSLDQWCFYYTQVTGQPCPRDPGDIIAAAGDPSPSFPQGRATPIDIGTWLAFMNQNGAGLSGLYGGSDVGLALLFNSPIGLMAIAATALMFLGGK